MKMLSRYPRPEQILPALPNPARTNLGLLEPQALGACWGCPSPVLFALLPEHLAQPSPALHLCGCHLIFSQVPWRPPASSLHLHSPHGPFSTRSQIPEKALFPLMCKFSDVHKNRGILEPPDTQHPDELIFLKGTWMSFPI